MLKIYGSSVSPNYNKVKLALLEKGIEFEEILQLPSQEESYLAKSPMGKIPVMEVDGQFLADSSAILDYLEAAYPAAPLLPLDFFERGKCREMMQIIDLYIAGTAGAARLTGAALFAAPISDEAKQEAQALIERGVKALAKLVKFTPFIMGPKFTQADCVAFPKLGFAGMVTTIVLRKNLIEVIPGAAEYLKYMLERPAVQKIVADQHKAMEVLMASIKK